MTVEHVSSSDSEVTQVVATATGSDALLMRRMVRRPGTADQSLVLARHRGRSVGVCAVVGPPAADVSGRTADDLPGPRQALIGSLYVVPEARGRGVSAVLVAAAVDVARRSGASRLIAVIDDGNDASMRAFSRAGFVPVSLTRTHFRFNRRRDELVAVGSGDAAASGSRSRSGGRTRA